jgi:hypothetical protein
MGDGMRTENERRVFGGRGVREATRDMGIERRRNNGWWETLGLYVRKDMGEVATPEPCINIPVLDKEQFSTQPSHSISSPI